MDSIGNPEDGRILSYVGAPYQVYVAKLNESMARKAYENTLVSAVEFDRMSDAVEVVETPILKGRSRSNGNLPKPKAAVVEKRAITVSAPPPFATTRIDIDGTPFIRQINAPHQLDRISDPCPEPSEIDFTYDANAAPSSFIYVLDTGVNLDHVVCNVLSGVDIYDHRADIEIIHRIFNAVQCKPFKQSRMCGILWATARVCVILQEVPTLALAKMHK